MELQTYLQINYAALAFVIGTIVGSFLNVVIIRVPEGQEILGRKSSSCPRCGHKIRWYDNIPVLSYMVLLRGACRDCKNPISWQYPFVEAVTGCLFLAIYLSHGFGVVTYLQWFLAAALFAIVCIDLEYQIIPDLITLPGIAVGFLGSLFLPGADRWMDSLFGIVFGGGFFLAAGLVGQWVTKQESMGGGDIKMAAMMGAFFGWKPLVVAITVGVFAGAVVAIALMLFSRARHQTSMPFGPALALGSFYVLFGSPDAVISLLFPYLI